MSGCPTGSEVGIAWLATLCQQTSSGSIPSIVSGTAVSTAGRTEWQVISHEIGHNFGAIVSVYYRSVKLDHPSDPIASTARRECSVRTRLGFGVCELTIAIIVCERVLV